jgi:hypothetical protein
MEHKFTIPKPETQSEYLARSAKENGKDQTVILGLLEAFGARGPISRRPAYNDPDKVRSDAAKDFSRAYYSDAMTYIDSLYQCHEEVYGYLDEILRFLEAEGYEADENGWPKSKSV